MLRRIAGILCCGILGFTPLLGARPLGLMPAALVEKLYLGLSSDNPQSIEALVHPADRAIVSLAGAIAQMYAPQQTSQRGAVTGNDSLSVIGAATTTTRTTTFDKTIELKTRVLSYTNSANQAVYWYEPAAQAKVLLSLPSGQDFIFLVHKFEGKWLARLNNEALSFMQSTRQAGTDPQSLRTTGRRSPSMQAKSFLDAMSKGNFVAAQDLVVGESRAIFNLLGLFDSARAATGFSSGAVSAAQIIDEQTGDTQAEVDCRLADGRTIRLTLKLEQGRWLVAFSPGL